MAVAFTTSTAQISTSSACTHYAAPGGTGNGLSAATPFKVSSFWAVAAPGTTLCLLDGTYTGTDAMIDPPDNLSGTASQPITVRAVNDGGALIDGQGRDKVVFLDRNSYWVLEGFNAARSGMVSVVRIINSTGTIVRRVAAWDAGDGNTSIFSTSYSSQTLFEDVAGWGIARKTFAGSQGGNDLTCRRCWGRLEGSHVVGPKMTYTLAYSNYRMLIENSIGTWSGEKMKQTYVLLDYSGQPWTGHGAGIYTDYAVDQPYGIFSRDRLSNDLMARSRILGSIAYVSGASRFQPSALYSFGKIDGVEIANSLAYIEPGSHPGKRAFDLEGLGRGVSAMALSARSLIGVSSQTSLISPEWHPTRVFQGKSRLNVPDPYTTGQICTRYQNGVLTSEPLWPWPMNQRIIEAMIRSGRAPVDVTQTIEGMFGPIPAQCRPDRSVR